MYGAENAVSYKYRVQDARLGRFLSIDPLAAKYPHNSPYASSENRVIDAVELEGREVKLVTHYVSQDGSIGETYVQINHAQTVIRNGERMARTQVRTVGPGGRGFDEYTDIYEPAYVPGGATPIPSAAYDYIQDVIPGKKQEDLDYIQNGRVMGGGYRAAQIAARDRNAPDNASTLQDLETLEAVAVVPLIGPYRSPDFPSSGGGGISRESIISKLRENVDLSTVHRLDPDAQIGIRGSLATGRKGPHKGNAPFDPNNFDVDAFIVFDKLAGQFSNKEWFRDGAKVGLS